MVGQVVAYIGTALLLIENSDTSAVPFRLKPHTGRDLRWWWVKEDKYFNFNSIKRFSIKIILRRASAFFNDLSAFRSNDAYGK